MQQTEIDAANSEFWNELCGTFHAKMLGITDRSSTSLKTFDDWFFDYYPYLAKHIPFSDFPGKKVLEVGLGYGSVSQKIAQAGGYVTSLDVAAGPVEMVAHRLQIHHLQGEAIQGSILEAPFPGEMFDYVISIGCYHHTGNLQRAIDETYRMLKPGGTMVLMLYNAYSYRRWQEAPLQTFKYFLWDRFDWGKTTSVSEAERASYDAHKDLVAPYIEFVSSRQLKKMCSAFRSFEARLENITLESPLNPSLLQWLVRFTWKLLGVQRGERENLMRTRWPALLGLDIYARAVK